MTWQIESTDTRLVALELAIRLAIAEVLHPDITVTGCAETLYTFLTTPAKEAS